MDLFFFFFIFILCRDVVREAWRAMLKVSASWYHLLLCRGVLFQITNFFLLLITVLYVRVWNYGTQVSKSSTKNLQIAHGLHHNRARHVKMHTVVQNDIIVCILHLMLSENLRFQQHLFGSKLLMISAATSWDCALHVICKQWRLAWTQTCLFACTYSALCTANKHHKPISWRCQMLIQKSGNASNTKKNHSSLNATFVDKKAYFYGCVVMMMKHICIFSHHIHTHIDTRDSRPSFSP